MEADNDFAKAVDTPLVTCCLSLYKTLSHVSDTVDRHKKERNPSPPHDSCSKRQLRLIEASFDMLDTHTRDKADADPSSGIVYAHSIFRHWKWEILAILLAIGIIAAIAALLAVHDGKPTPDWGERINLNALLAILSTILRAVLVVVVSQIISQRKWEWFGSIHERPLSELQRFDSGSRGSFGVMRLLPIVLLQDPITFTAAVILFASFLVGPSVQQASRTTDCTFADITLRASLPFAHYAPRRSGYLEPYGGSDQGVPAPDLMAAIISVATTPDSLDNQICGSCSTGNCTFPHGDPAKLTPAIANDHNFTTHSTVGMCSKCTDVTSLVSSEKSGTCNRYSLPNSVNVSASFGSDIIRVGPHPNLTWMGDIFTPEWRLASRWAYINLVSMRKDIPCVRTYASSIRDNEVSETFIRSSVMYPTGLDGSESTRNSMLSYLPFINTLNNQFYNYTAVQSPCRVNGDIYDIAQNMSTAPNGTPLLLHDLVDYTAADLSNITTINITAPEQCVYRQHPEFVMATSTLFNEELFDGSCQSHKRLTCRKGPFSAPGQSKDDLATLGASTVAESLYSNGYTGLENITRWFDMFSEMMTRRLRTDYGASVGTDSPRPLELPMGEAQGIAWRTTTCVSMRKAWLLLPLILTAITALLAVWTIMTNWRHRHRRPVWKDSILPCLFHGRDLVDGILDKYSFRGERQSTQSKDANQLEENNRPLETMEMEKLSRSTAVRLPWLHGVRVDCNHSITTQRKKWNWQHKKHRRDASGDNLLNPDASAQSLRGSNRYQVASADAGQHEEHPMLDLQRLDATFQQPGARDSHEYAQSYTNAPSQQSISEYTQSNLDERLDMNNEDALYRSWGTEENGQTRPSGR